MPSRSVLTVSLTPELERFIDGTVATGMYQSASEVVREGLRLLQSRQADTPSRRRRRVGAGGGRAKRTKGSR